MIKIRLRNDVSHAWEAVNPVLGEGEVGQEVDTGRFKMGDGSTKWTQLDYFVPRDHILDLIHDAIAEAQIGAEGLLALNEHINSPNPHPVYDDGPSLVLLYQNAKV